MDPFKDLAGLFQGIVAERTGAMATLVAPDLGTITSGLGLKLDGFKHIIPKEMYLISEHLQLKIPDFTETEVDGAGNTSMSTDDQPHVHDRVAHQHQVKTPSELWPLREGDRVLVVPVTGNHLFVVLCRVVKNA